jgi:tyrosine-protein kinase Etk/Wzc
LSDDNGLILQDYWRIIGKRKWTVILTVVVMTASAVTFSFLQTPIYEASTTLYLKKAKAGPEQQIDIFGGMSLLSTENEINTQIEILKSHTVMEEVARRLFSTVSTHKKETHKKELGKKNDFYGYLRNLFTLILGKFSQEEKLESVSEIAESLRKKNISVAPIRSTQLITLTASSDDPEMARLIANTTVEVFIERDISSRRRETTSALHFLSRETEKVAENLRQSEENLKRYKEKEGLAELSEKARLMVERLSELESLHQSTRISREELDNRLKEIRSQLKKVSKVWVSSTYISDNPLVQTLRSRLTDLEIKHAQLSREFSSDDPQVTYIKAQIEETKKELERKVKTVVAGKTESINPVYTELYTKLVSYETEVNALKAKEDALESLAAEYEKEVSKLPQQELALARLQRSQQVNSDLYAILVKAKNKAEIESASEIGTIEVVDPASNPTKPVKPKKKLNTLLGLISGLIFGVGLALFSEYRDKTIKNEDEAKKLLNLPVLGVIPSPRATGRYDYTYAYQSSNKKKKRKEIKARILEEKKTPIEIITRDLPRSPISEAYRALVTNLQFAELDRKLKTLVVTSSIPLEGKTSVAINLAITLASAGEKVLLADADLRFPRIHKVFQLDASPGLTDVLIANKSPYKVVHNIEGVDNLDLLTSGSLSSNPSELLRSSQMKKLILFLEVRKEYDRVLFDSPPLLGVADVPILSSNVNGILLVLGANEVDRQAAQKAKESLAKVKAHILGIILTKVKPGGSGYGEYYYHYYSSENGEI